MKIIIYLLLFSIVAFLMIGGYLFVTTTIEIYTLGNRIEDSLIAAGWAGFSRIDFEKMAERLDIDDEENRHIYIVKGEAEGVVRSYILENLKLDTTLYPTAESYIPNKDHPVLIDEITIYNPDELPVSCSRGVNLERTTIHIVCRIPIEIKWLGFRYLEKHVDVDIKSMYRD